MVESRANRLSARTTRVRDAYARFVEPAATGLPNWRVVTWFPTIIALGAIIFIILNISGTSSGNQWAVFGEGIDPNLLLGAPRPIRTDEWLVQQSWSVSQYQQGFPVINRTLPGGMDATVLMELPNRDWSTWFRPHLWGYLLFGLGAGVSWFWWIPAIGLVVGTYLFVVTLLPKRSLTAAVVACGMFFTPIFQWWYGPNALWPAAWSMLAMAATVWMLREPRLWVRVTWAAVLGWLAVTMAIGLYVPFILPSVLVFVFFFLGAVLAERPRSRTDWASIGRRLLPLIAAGVASVIVVVLWLVTRREAIDAVQSTVYPGDRTVPTGGALTGIDAVVAWAGAPFGQSFASGSVILGGNPSEAATAFLIAVFLLPAVIAFVVLRWRSERAIDWMLVGAIVPLAIYLAFMFVPGWDAIAKLLLLDKVPVTRYRMGFAVLVPVFFALVARTVDAEFGRTGRSRHVRLAIVSGAIAALSVVASLVIIRALDPGTLQVSRLWPVAALGLVAAVVLVFFRRGIPIAAVSFLVASLVVGAAVNPFYRGLFDLNQTKVGERVHELEEADPGTWVGVGGFETMAIMMQTGVEAYNGVQTYPPEEMWESIDPDGGDADDWNRLAHVRWTWGSGEPDADAPYPDALLINFDACSDFAQSNIDYVLSDEAPPSTACLEQLDDVEQGQSDFQLYRVVPAS